MCVLFRYPRRRRRTAEHVPILRPLVGRRDDGVSPLPARPQDLLRNRSAHRFDGDDLIAILGVEAMHGVWLCRDARATR